MRTRRILHPPPATQPCRYCIDGYTPAGTHHLIGPYYLACPTCITTGVLDACPSCAGLALFPAEPSLRNFSHHCADQGYRPVLCQGCYGLLGLVPIGDQTP